MKELIKKLCESFGPAGAERNIRSVIYEELKEFAGDISVDELGNLVVSHSPQQAEKHILVAAHMDEIGLMVTFIDDNGFLRFTNIGGVLPKTLVGSKVYFENGTVGVIGQEHLKDDKKLDISKLYIDIGADNKDTALEKVKIGSTAVFLTSFCDQGERITAKSVDNRIGCALLIEAFKQLPSSLPYNVSFAFTVQEEVGLRGARPLTYRMQPDFGLAVDVTRANDTPEPEFKTDVSLGKGPAVKVKDSSIICHSRVVDLMTTVAEENNIPNQMEVLERGGTDAGSIHLSREGVPTGVVSIPCRYLHSPSEMVDIYDVEKGIKLLVELLKREWW